MKDNSEHPSALGEDNQQLTEIQEPEFHRSSFPVEEYHDTGHSSDLLHPKKKRGGKKGGKKHTWRRIILVLVLLFVVTGCGAAAYVYSNASSTLHALNDGGETNVIEQIAKIVDEPDPLQGEEEDRINILLLGQGGLDHPGGTLADTVMIASIQPSTNKVSLLSIPRDLVVPYLPEGRDPRFPDYRKINNILYLGDGEMDYALETVKTLTGLEAHYYVVIDFAGFRSVIDTLGGIDVDVPNSFTDYSYPDYNYGYQTISFVEGLNTFDGETALQYARSRKGNNGEGGDIARAKRQQIIIEAVRQKALSASTLLNPVKISGLLEDLGDHVSTNMEVWEMVRFAQLAEDIDTTHINNQVVDGSENGLVYADRGQGGAFIFVPNAGLGDYSEIIELAASAFDDPTVERTATDEKTGESTATTAETKSTDSFTAEKAIIAVQNGTTIEGMAGTTGNNLESLGFTVESVSNATVRDQETTLIYDLSDGAHPNTAAALEKEFDVSVSKGTLPSEDASIRLTSDIDPNIVNAEALPNGTDFIIVLGRDQQGVDSSL